MKIQSLLLIVLLALSACAKQESVKTEVQAQPQAVHSDAQKSEKPAVCNDAQAEPAIQCADTVTAVFAEDGVLWVGWVDKEHIYLQSSSDKGLHFSRPVAVNAIAEPVAAKGEYRPKIALDKQGHIYVTWTRNLEKRHTGHIRFSRSVDGGKTFSEPVTLNDNLDVISHRFDSLLVGRNGEIFVVWLDARDKEKAKTAGQDFRGSSLYYTWSQDGGQHFQPNKLIAEHSCECCRLGVGIDKDNTPVVIWRQVFPGEIRDHALVKFKNWQTPGPLLRMSSENWKIDACPHHGPSLSITEEGTYHATWFSGAKDRQGLFYGHSKNNGASFSTPYRFGNAGAKHPNVLAIGKQVAVVWSEFDGSQNAVQLIRSQDGGETWSQAKVIGSAAGNVDDAFLLSDGKNLYLSWQTAQGYQFKPIDE